MRSPAIGVDRLTIAPTSHVISAINRPAMERAKRALALTCLKNAAETPVESEREHYADVARLAGSIVTVSVPGHHDDDVSTSSTGYVKLPAVRT